LFKLAFPDSMNCKVSHRCYRNFRILWCFTGFGKFISTLFKVGEIAILHLTNVNNILNSCVFFASNISKTGETRN